MNNTLYHYCSVESFHAIISGKSIRLSDLSTSNDSQEGKYGISLLCKELQKKYGYQEDPSKVIMELIADQIKGGGFCMSTQSDSLSQWRGYASDGHGFAIGFDKSMLESQFMRPNVELNKTNLIQVDYEETSQTNLSTSTCLKFHDFYQAIKGKKLTLENYKSNELIELACSLYQFIYSVKTRGFIEEKEWRLFTCLFSEKSDARPSFKGLVSFYELPLSENQDLITDVWIGPKNLSSKKVVQAFLKSNGFDNARVSISDISYR
jgi:Protein of unknown function (DUF2971)